MKKQVFKWTAVAFLLSVSIVCAYLYSALNQSVSDTPIKEDSLPTVQTPAPTPTPTPKTVFPKLPLLSPVSSDGFLQNFGGSGEDVVLDCKVLGSAFFVFGQSNSSDYDFSGTGLFISKLTTLGVVEKVVELKNATFLSSCLTESGVAVCFQDQNTAQIRFFDQNLQEIATYPILKSIFSCHFLVTSNYLFLLTESQHSLSIFRFTPDGREQKSLSLSLPNLESTVGFSFVFERLIFLVNQNSTLSFFALDENLSLSSQKTFSFPYPVTAQSAIPAFINQTVGFVATVKSQDFIYFLGLTESGKVAFSTQLTRAENSALVRTQSGDYIAFCSDDTKSSATRICSHGDILEQNVLALSGYFPKDFLYLDDSLVLLLENQTEKSGTVVYFNAQNTLTFSHSFQDIEPICLALCQNGLLLALNATNTALGFGSGYGKTDGFLLNLK